MIKMHIFSITLSSHLNLDASFSSLISSLFASSAAICRSSWVRCSLFNVGEERKEDVL